MPFLVLLIILTFAISLYAQFRVQSTYNHYSKIYSLRGMTGAEAARSILRAGGIFDIQIVAVKGFLTDHYNPTNKTLALSEKNYHGNSLAALGVAAHEAGHALQHAAGYAPLNFRMALVPVTTFCSKLLPVIMLMALLGLLGPALSKTMLFAVVGIYMILTLFQLVTLPVEFDASRRARKQLLQLGILDPREIEGVSRTLDAAALTYVAAFISTLVWMLYYFTLANRR